MSNEEFDLLKEELMWEGSSVVMLSKYNLVSNLRIPWLYSDGLIFFYCLHKKNYSIISYAGSDEQKFLEASMAYVSGKPILTDEEYDKLKLQLKVCLLFVCAYFDEQYASDILTLSQIKNMILFLGYPKLGLLSY